MPEEAAKDFIDISTEVDAAEGLGQGKNPLPPELRTPEGALAGAREWYAHALAASLELRRAARSHFKANARLTTEATPKGKSEIDPTHPLYRVVSELHSKTTPLEALLPPPPPYLTRERHLDAVKKAELLLLAKKAEALEMVTMVIKVPEDNDQLLLSLIHI